MLENIQLEYTNETLPAPFAHACSLKIDLSEEKININIALKYFDRELLTEEEIWEEGFSGQDDFSWKGILPESWRIYLNQAILENALSQDTTEDEVIVVTATGQGVKKQIKNKKSSVYLMQELLQASLEGSGKEMPLNIRWQKKDPAGTTASYIFLFSFYNLQLQITSVINGNTTESFGRWSSCRELLIQIFIPDYLEDMQIAKTPKNAGTFIDPGEGVWYDTSNAVRIGKRKYSLEKIETLMMEEVRLSTSNP